MGEIRDLLRSDSLKLRQAGSRALKMIADEAVLNIQRRLDAGISSHGTPFIPYAPSTAKRKGRRRPVTLRESGNMRSKIFVRRRRLDRYEVTFRDREAERIARFQHGGTRRRTRADAKAHARARGTRRIVRNTGPYHIPPRPFIEPTRQEIEAADRIHGVEVTKAFPSDLRRRILITFKV